MAKNKKRAVTQADIDLVLATLNPQLSSKDMAKRAAANSKYSATLKSDLEKSRKERGKTLPVGRGKQPKDEQTRKYLNEMRGADRDSEALGKPREEKQSWGSRLIDVISRGNYASAEAFRRASNPNDNEKWDFTEGFKGFAAGLTGKKKTTFKDVLKEQGFDGRGMGTLGFALDVVADPLTWTGVGTVAKAAASSKRAAELIEEVADVEKRLVSRGASREQVRDALNVAAVPAQNVKKKQLKNLTTEGRQVYDYAIDARGANTSNAVAKVVTQFKRKVKNSAHLDLRWFPDDKLRETAVNTIRAEEKAYPGLTSILRRARATREGMTSPADSFASYEKFKAGQPNGIIRFDPRLAGNRKYMDKYAKAPDSMLSVNGLKDADEAIRYMTIHEVGHQMAQAMSPDVQKAVWEKASAKFGKSKTMDESTFLNYFEDLEQRVLGAEKSEALEPLTKVQQAALDSGDWKLFSKKRGYTDEQIADFDEFTKLLETPGLKLDDMDFIPVPYPKGSAKYGQDAQSIQSIGELFSRLSVLGKVPVGKPSWADELSEYSTKSYPNEVAAGIPGFNEMTAEAWAEYRMLGAKSRPMAKAIAEEMIKNAPKVPSKSETDAILKQLVDDFIMADVKNVDEWATAKITKKYGDVYGENIDELEGLVKEGLEKRGITDIKASKKAMQEQLLAITARNIDPGVKKQFALKIGPTSVGIPKSYEAVMAANKAITSIPGIKQSVDKFNDMFRATAYLPKSLDNLRAKSMGSSMFGVTQQLKLLQSVFDKVSKDQRKGIMQAIKTGALQGNKVRGGLDINGNPVDDLVKYVYDEFTAMDISRLGNDLSLSDLNDFLGNKYKITTPENKLIETQVKRVNQYGQEYTAKVATKSQEANPTAIFDAIMNNPRVTDPAHALYLYGAALNQAIAKKNMWTTVANTHGVPKGELGDKLLKEYGWVAGPIKGTKDFYFPPEVAQGMSKIEEVFKDARSTGQFVDQYDRLLQGFKSVVTRYNPSFQSRTFLGEVLLGYMGGMKSIPRSYSKAFKVINGRNENFMGTPENAAAFGEKASGRLIQASNVLRGATPTTAADGGKTIINHGRYGQLTADQIWSYFLESGLKSGYASTDLVRGTNNPVGGKFLKSRDVMMAATENVEDVGRLAHFIDVIQNSKFKTLDEAVEEAAAVTRKYHLDYTSVTGFEKNVMTRAMPFYKWMRLSTPLMAEILLTKPGKALAVPKAMREISSMAGYDPENFGAFPGGADAVVPEWLRDSSAVPIFEFGGNTNYFDPTAIFPLSGSMETAEQGGANMITPFFKWGADLYQGKDKFGNQLTGENSTRKDWQNYLGGQTPQGNFANQMITQKDPGIPRMQTILQFLANPGIQPNTEKRMRGEAFRQRQEAYSHRKNLKKEQGLIP